MIQELYSQGLGFDIAGHFTEAIAIYQQIIQLQPDRVDIWQRLGQVYCDQGDYDQALTAIHQALTFDPENDSLYCDLAWIWQQLGNSYEAIQFYQIAINFNSNNSIAYSQLGNLWVELGQLEAAKNTYHQALKICPEQINAYLGLGNLFMLQNQIDAAIAVYEQALKLNPEDSDLLYQYGLAIAASSNPSLSAFYFGSAAYYQQDYQTAIDDYQTLETLTLDVYLKLADCYQQLNQTKLAISLYQQALTDYPNSVELYLGLILILQDHGDIEKAIQIAEQGLKQNPNQIRLQLAHQRLLPILYQNSEEIQEYRQRFQHLLVTLIDQCSLETAEQKQQALQAIADGTNFYLQYQGLNDLTLQQHYGEWVSQVMAANYPCQTLTHQNTGKLKIGYVSAFFNWHTVGILFLGWIKHHRSDLFETYCYHLSSDTDSVTDLFRFYSDHFYQLSDSLETAIQKITEDKIDILVFLDIGMFAPATQLAGLRLAPIQCVAWGHPITTGLPTIDYFISAEHLETFNAKTHYSEDLITLPNLGIYYQKPPIPAVLKKRADFGLCHQKIIYLSSQSLFKYLPQYDELFVAITQQVKNAQFVFISHWNPEITDQFKTRLSLAFSKVRLNFENYCVILPRLDQQDYLQLHLLSDIGLDTIQFTGFLTSLNAIACNLPIVTCEGEWMRSRQTAGILKRMNLTALIAQNPAEYIKIAVRLGLDSDWRISIAKKIKQNQSILYNDIQTVQALEQFYLSAGRNRIKNK